MPGITFCAGGRPIIRRYLEIRNDILQRITLGEWPQGMLLPSENALAKDYGVTRVTVRQALQTLEQERFVTSRQGVGRYVNPRVDQVVSMLTKLESMDKMMAISEATARKQIVEFVPIQLSEEEARHLNTQPSADAMRMVRIRYVGNLAAAVSVNIFPLQYAPPESVAGSILDTLDDHGHHVDYAETEVLIPTKEDAYLRYLTEDDAPPILLLRQLHMNMQHQPIFLAFDYLNMNVFSIQVTRHR
ncbi:GntR family transcriptional regulator [Alicyclobacillus fodiniaquatilis]|uniref:GntR family transcriptional regulator n=1 Tax=Alicyclobacillus fodiniaquatilis TaxID=1661150 RepID=A0ABW4JJZ9_9BACL